MNIQFPNKLKAGDEVRVIAPSKSLGIISRDNRKRATEALEKLGLRLSFGKHVEEEDMMGSSSVESRLSDLHDAFSDKNVKGILTVLGGYNSNQLLDDINYDLIQKNPKIFCGFSDITALGNAIHHKTGLVTYSGPHYSSFAMQKGFEYTLEYFKKTFFENNEITLHPSEEWSEDAWFLDQENRTFHSNKGLKVINPGQAQGKIIGGNLGTLRLLCGTPYMPDLKDTILFLEEVASVTATDPLEFDRDLQALIQDPGFEGIRGIVLGRFENSFGMTDEKLNYILATKPKLKNIPIVVNADFGHTTPIFTFPIGGMARIEAGDRVQLGIERY